MGGLGDWLSVAGPLIAGKAKLLNSQAASNYGQAEQNYAQAEKAGAEAATESLRAQAQANRQNASAYKTTEEGKVTAPLAETEMGVRRATSNLLGQQAIGQGIKNWKMPEEIDSEIGLNNASATQARANAGLMGEQSSELRDGRPVRQRGYGLIMKQPDSVLGNMFGGAGIRPYGDFRKSILERKDGGVAGDVRHDDGTDKLDVKVRPGEYMLNPETVAFIGGGDYREGLRNLDNLVKQATGKEPGPSPVGKPHQQGYAKGGRVAELIEGWKAGPAAGAPAEPVIPAEPVFVEPPRGGALVPVEGTGRTGYRPNFTMPPEPGAGPAQTWSSGYGAPSSAAKSIWQQFRENPAAFGQQGGQAMREALPSKEAIKGVARSAAAPAVVVGAEMIAPRHQEFYNDPNVPNAEKVKQTLREFAREGVGVAGGALGGGVGSVVGPVGTVGGAVTGYAGGKALADKGLSAVFGEGPAAQYEAKMRADGKTPAVLNTGWFGPADKPTAAPTAAKAEAKPAMDEDAICRAYVDYYNARVSRNGRAEFDAGMALLAAANQRGGISYMDNLMQGNTTAANNAATRSAARAKEIDSHLAERYQTPITDKDGNLKGYEKNPDAARQVRDVLAEKGIDIYSAPQAVVDRELRDLDQAYRGISGLNNVVTGERGDKAVISSDLRGLRVTPGISITDVFAPNNAVSLGDWGRGLIAGQEDINNMLVTDPRTNQTAAAGRVFRKPDGTIDFDAYDKFKKKAK